MTESIQYLANLAQYVPNNAIKSQYFIKCVQISIREGVNLPSKFKHNLSRCPKCLIPHQESNSKYYIKPMKKRIAKKKIKEENGENKKIKYNYFVIECNFCKYEVKRKLEKPMKRVIIEDMAIPLKKKKRKRQDRFSGLNQEAVLAVSPKVWERKDVATPTKTIDDFKQEKRLLKQSAHKEKIQKEEALKKKKEKLNKLGKVMNKKEGKRKSSGGLKDFLNALCKK